MAWMATVLVFIGGLAWIAQSATDLWNSLFLLHDLDSSPVGNWQAPFHPGWYVAVFAGSVLSVFYLLVPGFGLAIGALANLRPDLSRLWLYLGALALAIGMVVAGVALNNSSAFGYPDSGAEQQVLGAALMLAGSLTAVTVSVLALFLPVRPRATSIPLTARPGVRK